MLAALYVQKDGVYYGIPGIDPWDEERDARKYTGPYKVIAHPPCARWGKYWFGSPRWGGRKELGDDNGCFESALSSVEVYGGVIEHPKGSKAWERFGIQKPFAAGWSKTRLGWTCEVEQGHYGHLARKATWLYYVGPRPAPLIWGPSLQRKPVEMMSHRERAATPAPFRDMLIHLCGGKDVP